MYSRKGWEPEKNLYFLLFCFVFETGFHVVQASLKLRIQARITSTSWSCSCVSGAGIILFPSLSEYQTQGFVLPRQLATPPTKLIPSLRFLHINQSVNQSISQSINQPINWFGLTLCIRFTPNCMIFCHWLPNAGIQGIHTKV